VDVPDSQDADIARFTKWARRVHPLGHVLRRIEYRPESMPDLVGRPVVMVANHRSLADVFLAVEALDHYDLPARCLVRAKYFENGIAGRWLSTIGCIPAGDGNRESVDIALETLAAGRPVAVMIEGRIVPPDRRESDGMGEIRPGFVEIARKADAEILPIGIVGSDDIWRSRGSLPRVPWRGRAKVVLTTGTTISVDGKSDEVVIAETRAMIAGYLAES
jgi:1-acyl-sn-glycerol-3-phosphate acyltransferase